MAETKPTSALHLTEHQRQAAYTSLRSNNVDLAEPTAPIPLQHLHALPLQLAQARSSPCTPSCCLDSVLGIALPPRQACGRQPRIVQPHRNLWKWPSYQLRKLPRYPSQRATLIADR